MLHWVFFIIPTECEHLINLIFFIWCSCLCHALLSHQLIPFHSAFLSSVILVRSRFCTSCSILIFYSSFFLICTIFCVNNNINNSTNLLWEGGWTTWPAEALLIYFFFPPLMGLETLYKHHSLICGCTNLMQLFTN